MFDVDHNHAPPVRSDYDVRSDVPQPPDPRRSPVDQHWRKHPSDFHADCATGRMIEAANEPDSLARQNLLREAQVYASLSLRDAVLEATATLRECVARLIDPQPKEQ